MYSKGHKKFKHKGYFNLREDLPYLLYFLTSTERNELISSTKMEKLRESEITLLGAFQSAMQQQIMEA